MARPRKGAAVALWLLVLADVVLLAYATWLGPEPIRDDGQKVTTGYLTALTTLLALLVAAAMPLVRLPRPLTRRLQVFFLAAMMLHGSGHLARLYYEQRFYDDALHFLLAAWFSLLALQVARACRVIPRRDLRPAGAAVIVLLSGLAAAGTWEIVEYAADLFTASREQDDLPDTMQDMVMSSLGAITAAILVYRAVSRQEKAGGGSAASGPPPGAGGGRDEPGR